MSAKTDSKTASHGVTRRDLLKGTAALTGAAVGSGVIGTPMIWAQNIKDVTLNQVGPSFSVIADIAEKASADLGFKIVAQTSDTTQLMAKVVNQPETIDIADLEFWGLQKVYRSGNLQPVDIAKIKMWGDITPLMRDGKTFDGSDMSRQGTLPVKVLYTDSADSAEFAAAPTGLATAMPTI